MYNSGNTPSNAIIFWIFLFSSCKACVIFCPSMRFANFKTKTCVIVYPLKTAYTYCMRFANFKIKTCVIVYLLKTAYTYCMQFSSIKTKTCKCLAFIDRIHISYAFASFKTKTFCSSYSIDRTQILFDSFKTKTCANCSPYRPHTNVVCQLQNQNLCQL